MKFHSGELDSYPEFLQIMNVASKKLEKNWNLQRLGFMFAGRPLPPPITRYIFESLMCPSSKSSPKMLSLDPMTS